MTLMHFALAWLTLLGPLRPEKEAPTRFVVIVNAANPESSINSDSLAEMFLKQRKKWRNGERILPVDQSAASLLRSTFSAEIFGQQASALRAYWETEVTAGRDAPPPVRDNDAQVLAFVSANPGAIGYVDKAALLAPNVKVLRIIH